ncbi:MAG: hypothetical protein ACI8W3_002565 [Myxococcota bacterium]|jgi:hypothetical protein
MRKPTKAIRTRFGSFIVLSALCAFGLSGVLRGNSLAVETPAANRACTETAQCRARFALSTGTQLSYFESHPLQVANEAIRAAVLVVHGNRRDPDHYYAELVQAAATEARLEDTLLLAPRFPAEKDLRLPREPYWSSHGWKIGNKSQDRQRISSFAVIDEILSEVCPLIAGRFSNLERVVLVGHSAGGQFLNRYIAGGASCPNPNVEVRFVVMNPSSYLYIDERRTSASGAGFEPPSSGCKDFDEYKYGLGDLNSYMKRAGREKLSRQLFTRDSYYVAGDKDTKIGGSLDGRCEANLQGQNRLQRFKNYRAYHSLFDSWVGARFVTVPGIGHQGGAMLQSETVRSITFR